jgi:hypothetical protein
MNRRRFLAGASAAALADGQLARGNPPNRRASAAGVLKREMFPLPINIDALRLLKRDKDYLVHIGARMAPREFRWSTLRAGYGLDFQGAQASVEFAIFDMPGRIARKSIAALVGDIVSSEVPFYVANGRRNTNPKDGKLCVPAAPGVGIKDIMSGLLKESVEG